MKIFKPTFKEAYELAKNTGDKKFGSNCKHKNIKNGYCIDCFRKVFTKRKELK